MVIYRFHVNGRMSIASHREGVKSFVSSYHCNADLQITCVKKQSEKPRYANAADTKEIIVVIIFIVIGGDSRTLSKREATCIVEASWPWAHQTRC